MAETTAGTGRRPDVEMHLEGNKIAAWKGKYGWSFVIPAKRERNAEGQWGDTAYRRVSDLIVLQTLLARMIDFALNNPVPKPQGNGQGEDPIPE